MANLTSQQRREVWAEWIRKNLLPISISKVDLRAAVDAVDAWVDANGASFNSAIPQPARGELSTKQKAMILVYVALKRFEVV